MLRLGVVHHQSRSFLPTSEPPPPYSSNTSLNRIATSDQHAVVGAGTTAGATAHVIDAEGAMQLVAADPHRTIDLVARPLRQDLGTVSRILVPQSLQQSPLDLAVEDIAEAIIAETLPDPRAKPSCYTSSSDRVNEMFCRQLLNRLSPSNQKLWVRFRPRMTDTGVCFFSHFATIVHAAKSVGVPEKRLDQLANQWARYALCGGGPGAANDESPYSWRHLKSSWHVAVDATIDLMREISTQYGEVPGHSQDVVDQYACDCHDTLIRKAIDVVVDRTALGPTSLRCQMEETFGDARDILNALQSSNTRDHPFGAQHWRRNIVNSMNRMLRTTMMVNSLTVSGTPSAPRQ